METRNILHKLNIKWRGVKAFKEENKILWAIAYWAFTMQHANL